MQTANSSSCSTSDSWCRSGSVDSDIAESRKSRHDQLGFQVGQWQSGTKSHDHAHRRIAGILLGDSCAAMACRRRPPSASRCALSRRVAARSACARLGSFLQPLQFVEQLGRDCPVARRHAGGCCTGAESRCNAARRSSSARRAVPSPSENARSGFPGDVSSIAMLSKPIIPAEPLME